MAAALRRRRSVLSLRVFCTAMQRPAGPPSRPGSPERADGGGWLSALRFDNLALRSLPVDPSEDCAPRAVPGACFARVRPTPLRNPRLVAMSAPALALLGLEAGGPEAEREAEAALYFSGNRLLPGSEPAAHCYCGHQFGSFAGQLGDGAAIYLGEVRGPRGARWELQLKGAGITPFSRYGAVGRGRAGGALRTACLPAASLPPCLPAACFPACPPAAWPALSSAGSAVLLTELLALPQLPAPAWGMGKVSEGVLSERLCDSTLVFPGSSVSALPKLHSASVCEAETWGRPSG